MSENLYPKVVDDINHWKYNNHQYSIGSMSVDRYLRVDEKTLEAMLQAISFFDGKHSLDEIDRLLNDEYKIKVDSKMLYNKLRKTGLIEGEAGADYSSEIQVMGTNLLKFEFPIIKQSFRDKITILYKIIILFAIIMLLTLLTGVVVKWDRLQSFSSQYYMYEGKYWKGTMLIIFFSILSLANHEIFHWIAAIRFGLQPSEANVTLYTGIIPMVYIKTRGMYTLENTKRSIICAAGMFSNLLFSVCCLNVVMWFDCTSNMTQILLKVFISNLYTFVLSLSPFSLSDGYYLISWMLGITNLRIKVLNIIRSILKRQKFHVEKVVVIYSAIASVFLMLSTISQLQVSYLTVKEISASSTSMVIRILVYMVPVIFFGISIALFIKRFKKFLNYTE